eukprot:CAMPEP_0201545598 /NCGR_PEP_ID=MMETSP0173_2-20130828/2063_1 /ASSEMBLY_ACC=CAM_ASM_000268 /TAXON_ID=218659 /ORGANISM="Vexillifera sp., Strain DIVA3 564/2" /LENGTH=91 /DNA_ID=CAMNT_0047954033 /DNA_START=305 /DNA_END=576 /DNA_ORIENTATION=-
MTASGELPTFWVFPPSDLVKYLGESKENNQTIDTWEFYTKSDQIKFSAISQSATPYSQLQTSIAKPHKTVLTKYTNWNPNPPPLSDYAFPR